MSFNISTSSVRSLGSRSCGKIQKLCVKSNWIRPRALHFKRVVRAGSGEDSVEDSLEAVAISASDARQLLGVREGASFDEVLQAKNKLVKETQQDQEKIILDAAYDTLLMESFKARQSGKVSSSSVKYADVVTPSPPTLRLPQWASKLSPRASSAPAVLAPPSLDVLQEPLPNALFAALLVWSLFQGLSDQQFPGAEVPSTQLAIAVGLSVFFLRDKKRLTLQRGALLTLGALVTGGLVGQLLQAWLQVDIVPLGLLDSPQVLVSETALLAVWATCALLA
mmetsp:Transcript_12881/g.17608  ORF Transcript_12881/g.17608 Transcript_12881/m.17608 type:complete len:280 (+) Transcript_12881:119-958(+)|eukprot:CAMPEP_0196580012 /NCGR_PEP_ID=MMETSP1081-20130531/26276_1 /TAXON_ID=36882 /ORGANISM="Pyramimonas amylifera, Strain CCMP720" /LENGTH=279 /DNA_ID=CAMNT_0041899761 /DNA_START=119 /DNA_END=958 /DNA_ORIENTATION=-